MSTLSKQQQLWLNGRARPQVLKPRTAFILPGSPATELSFISNGKMKVEARSVNDNLLIKRIYSNGDFIGLKALAGLPYHLETYRTMRSPTELLTFDTADFQLVLEVNYEFRQALLRFIGNEMRFFEERASSLLHTSARRRFLDFMLDLAARKTVRNGDEWMFDSELTQAEIGCYIGTGRQTVTEILGELERSGILRYDWGRIYVKDLNRLRK